jgi:HPt (histidine-containing phosphotransfer) domain-containing protein
MDRLAGDPQAMREFAASFLAQYHHTMEQIHAAIPKNDLRAIHHLAREIKEAAATFEANEVVEAAELLEKSAGSYFATAIPTGVTCLERQLEEFSKQLEELTAS